MNLTSLRSAVFGGACALALAACSGGEAPRQVQAPPTYRVELDTSAGPFVIEITRSDAPFGADRFYNLVEAGYFTAARFFRVVPGFVAQFGLAADPAVTKAWQVPITDDPVRTGNLRGTLTFAMTQDKNSRTTQLFINLEDNRKLDGIGFAPFGRIISGLEVIDRLYSRYGQTPDQDEITRQGNAYLTKNFPKLDYIKKARIVP